MALLPLPTLALALFYTLLVVLALIDPIFGLYWAILSVPIQELVHLPGGISYTQGAMLLALAAWALRVLAHPERPAFDGLIFRDSLNSLFYHQDTKTPRFGKQRESLLSATSSSILGALTSWWLFLKQLLNTKLEQEPGNQKTAEPGARAGHVPPIISRSAIRWLWLWGAFLWALLLALAFSPYSRAEAAKELLRWAEAFLIWLMVLALARRPWQIAGLIACLLLAPAAEALVGLAQFFSGAGPPSFRIAPALPFVRAYGTIGQPNSFAGYMNMAWPLAFALAVGATITLWQHNSRRPTTDDRRSALFSFLNAQYSIRRGFLVLGFWFLVALLLAALAASLSRGAWVGAACGAAGMALALGRRARRWALAGLGLGALALALGGAGLLPAVVADRLASITRYLAIFDAGSAAITPQNFAVVERMAQMQAGWRMFLAHPLTGVGPGNYTPAYPSFAVGTWYASRGHAHNYYINMLAETGLIGALAYLALLAGAIRQAVATLRARNRTIWRSAAIGCCGIIAAVIGHDLFENLHVLSMGIQLAAVWGLLAVLEKPVAR